MDTTPAETRCTTLWVAPRQSPLSLMGAPTRRDTWGDVSPRATVLLLAFQGVTIS